MDLHERWPHRWRNEKTQSFDSPIHGLGVIATRSINKDEPVLVYGGIIVPAAEIKEYWAICGHAGIQISDDFFIVPATRDELESQGIINHSCEPNVGFRGQVELVALKNIKQGEEIAFDYAFCETLTEPFDCRCGTSSCRHRVTPEDWKLPALHEKYGDYFSPYLKDKIRKENQA